MAVTEDNQLLVDAVLSNKAALFLGSGAVASSVLKNGNKSPVGSGLAKCVYEHFYPNDKYDNEALAFVCSLVQSEFGKDKLFEFFQNFFSEIKPSEGLRKITEFKWANIYTTNIDRAIEIAYNQNKDRAQKVVHIVGAKDVATEDKNIEVNLFKLHGCISRPDVDLVFSLEEYAEYKEPHLKLFHQLSIDLVERPLIFIGYSLQDSNFQQTWSAIKKYCSTTHTNQQYFFVAPTIKTPFKNFLVSEGFTCFEYTLDDFVRLLTTLTVGRRTTLRDYFIDNTKDVDIFTKSTIDEESKYTLSQNYNFPKLEVRKPYNLNTNFYKGTMPGWSDIKHNLDAQRDLTSEMLLSFENWYANPKFNFWLISGRAGDGKSTLLKRLSLELSERIGDGVLFAKSRADLSPIEILKLYDNLQSPLVIIVDNTTDRIPKVNHLINSLRLEKAKILIIGASRNSDVHAAINDFFVKPVEFSLNKLSDNEISNILTKLELHNSLHKLSPLSAKSRFNSFKERASRELIVAMREATSALQFEEIIANEFVSIKHEAAKKIYLHICFIHQFRYSVPQSLLFRVFNLDYKYFRDEVLKYTKDIICEDYDSSGADILLSARHSVIAQVVSKIYFNDDVVKIEFLKLIFQEYIPSRALESSLIKKLYHHTTISKMFNDSTIAISCYDQLIVEMPDDYYLLQQKSLYLINNSSEFDEAKDVIKEALRLNPTSSILHHTHGTILMKQALFEEDIDKSKYYLEEAKRILMRGVRRNHHNVYNYHTLISYLINWYKKDNCQSDELIIEIQLLIDEATLKNPNDTLILTEHGKVYQLLKNVEKSKNYFEKALGINPRNMAARYLLARILMSENNYQLALTICDEGLALKKDEVSINRLRFEILHVMEVLSPHEMIDEYESYLSQFPLDNFIKLCFASYLYIEKNSKCDKVFSELRYFDYMSYSEKLKIVYDVNKIINRENFKEHGVVSRIIPTGYYLKSERFNAKTFVFLGKNDYKNLKIRDRMQYNLLFSYLGGFASQAELIS